MENINKKTIIHGLGILAILAFGVIIIPTLASADIAGHYTPYVPPSIYGNNDYMIEVSHSTYNRTYNTFSKNNQNITSSTSNNTNKTTSSSSTNTNTANSNTSNASNTNATNSNSDTSKTNSTSGSDSTARSLVASIIFGANTFLPSGLVQWISLAIIILLIVILARRTLGYREDYLAIPLKHE